MVENKFSILIVDDEKDVSEMLSKGLLRRGYFADTAPDAESALVKVKENTYEVVVLDIVLPGMDGIEALEQIKRIDPDTEVIMITGHSSLSSAIESMKRGAFDYMEKPVTIESLVVYIEKALEKHNLMEMVALYEISNAIFSTIDRDELLKIIVDLTMKVLRADDTSIMLFDGKGELYIAISYGLDEEIKRNTRLAIGERIAGWVAENAQPVILINGLGKDPRFKGIRGREDIKSALVVPLIKKDRVLGILTANRIKITDNFNNSDLYKANIFTSLVSLALDNANLYKELEDTRDELLFSSEELKSSQNQLFHSAKMAALGRMVSDMAHEVNNPLMVISGTAQLALMEGVKDDNVKNSFNVILEECKRAKEIISRLLQFSRPSKGEFKRADINSALEGVISLLGHQFILSGVEIRVCYDRDLPLVDIDEKQIQEIILNMLNNAKDAMGGKGLINLSTCREGVFIRIDIEDTGPGMSQEVLNKIFDPFFTTKEKGTGLGLAICKSIIKNHSGEIRVQSSPGKGTVFSILLPSRKESGEDA